MKKQDFIVKSPSIEDIFEDFCDARMSEGIKEKTIQTYKAHLKAMSPFFDIEKSVDNVTNKDIIQAITRISKTDVSRNSIRSYTATLSSFFHWMRDENIADLSVALFKGEETIPETYTEEELRALLKHPKKGAMFSEYRSWAIVNLLVNNGIRAGSVRSIQIRDVNLERSVIVLRHNKTKKVQNIPLCPALITVLHEWMKIRKGKPDDWLFPDYDGGQMTEDGFRHSIVRYNKSRGVRKTGIHMFRHTFARTYIVDCKGNALKLQKLLGHSTLKMTERYVKIYDSDLVNDFQEISPLSVIQKKRR